MKTKILAGIILLAIGIVSFYVGMSSYHEGESTSTPTPLAPIITNTPTPTVTPIPTQTPTPTLTPTPTPISIPTDGLKHVIDKSLEGTTGVYGVVVINFQTGERYAVNEHRVFVSASLYKLWVMATAFDEIQNGRLREDELLHQSIAVLNREFDISTRSAELTEGTISLSVKNALEKMITISHNYAALLLSERVKLSTVRRFLVNYGFTESALGEPTTTTAYDIALFFEKLYNGELADQEHTDKMTDLLKRQMLNNKLAKYLPLDLPVAHKTGEIDLYTHDAGITFGTNGDYVIAVLSESYFPPGAAQRIADISKAVYDYFEGK
ncbi:hypothetical protein A2Z00_03645 [Candidatus Gottesmanbacteria bacterium RBG_13_45_10]|uniref:Beta-lactamase class A catalytic domain-containing protein n=1 Tax=Candidatus Gottesmanbacteria bacterium RBG_13_45_10 TaxID=1798370 RepID=A0A1F5ZH49_9BACT|nr:MAG: hypothetical protein A2Z00_03645 [Candidatus Gottesmanbacteria bacterium RBG_13_45_10]